MGKLYSLLPHKFYRPIILGSNNNLENWFSIFATDAARHSPPPRAALPAPAPHQHVPAHSEATQPLAERAARSETFTPAGFSGFL